MDRNKHIYAMADYSFVAQSDTRGGTWTGAVEDLKRPAHHPLYVYMGRSRVEGCARLVEKGGIAWRPGDTLEQMKRKAADLAKDGTSMRQASLFDDMDVSTKCESKSASATIVGNAPRHAGTDANPCR